MTRFIILFFLAVTFVGVCRSEVTQNSSSVESPAAAAVAQNPKNNSVPEIGERNPNNETARPANSDVDSSTQESGNNETISEKPIVNAIANRNVEVLRPAFQCYVCKAFEGTKCDEKSPNLLQDCGDERQCYYIVGDLEENGKKFSNSVWTGCGSAPALVLPGNKQAVTHTHHNKPTCNPISFTHDDLGADSPVANYSLSFKGHSCNCEQSACNGQYTKYLSSDNAGEQWRMNSLLIAALLLAVLVFARQ